MFVQNVLIDKNQSNFRSIKESNIEIPPLEQLKILLGVSKKTTSNNSSNPTIVDVNGHGKTENNVMDNSIEHKKRYGTKVNTEYNVVRMNQESTDQTLDKIVQRKEATASSLSLRLYNQDKDENNDDTDNENDWEKDDYLDSQLSKLLCDASMLSSESAVEHEAMILNQRQIQFKSNRNYPQLFLPLYESFIIASPCYQATLKHALQVSHIDTKYKPTFNEKECPVDPISGFALRYLKRFGYVEGSGLGRRLQGHTAPLRFSVQPGRTGLGLERLMDIHHMSALANIIVEDQEADCTGRLPCGPLDDRSGCRKQWAGGDRVEVKRVRAAEKLKKKSDMSYLSGFGLDPLVDWECGEEERQDIRKTLSTNLRSGAMLGTPPRDWSERAVEAVRLKGALQAPEARIFQHRSRFRSGELFSRPGGEAAERYLVCSDSGGCMALAPEALPESELAALLAQDPCAGTVVRFAYSLDKRAVETVLLDDADIEAKISACCDRLILFGKNDNADQLLVLLPPSLDRVAAALFVDDYRTLLLDLPVTVPQTGAEVVAEWRRTRQSAVSAIAEEQESERRGAGRRQSKKGKQSRSARK